MAQSFDSKNNGRDKLHQWLTKYVGHKSFLFTAGAVAILAVLSRFWVAPLSAGPDIAQFWAFAQVFGDHGLDFYQYADATDGTFPFWGWKYAYPPLWLFILKLGSLATPGSFASAQVIDESWRIAEKTPIILSDLVIGGLIFWAVPGSRWKKLLFSAIWLLHPTGWYQSSVFGQFDAMATAFLLASIVLFARSHLKLGFLFAGMAVLTKQHTFLPVVMVLAVVLQQTGIRTFIRNCSVMAGVVILFSVPFLTTGNVRDYMDALFLPGWSPDYQQPLSYAFSGSSSLLTYLHNNYGWDTRGFMDYNTPVLAVAMLTALALTRFRAITLAQAALVGALLFVGLNYQVNYQYLVIYIPLAVLVAGQTTDRWHRLVIIGLAVLPAVWMWMFDVSFWFYAYRPHHYYVRDTLDTIGLTNYMPSDLPYVIFALCLMFVCLGYVVATFTFWHRDEVTPHHITQSERLKIQEEGL